MGSNWGIAKVGEPACIAGVSSWSWVRMACKTSGVGVASDSAGVRKEVAMAERVDEGDSMAQELGSAMADWGTIKRQQGTALGRAEVIGIRMAGSKWISPETRQGYALRCSRADYTSTM